MKSSRLAHNIRIATTWHPSNRLTLYRGDCRKLLALLPSESVDLVLSSPPYCIGKSYEDKTKPEEFFSDHKEILPEVVRVLKTGGSLCWQVGYHVKQGTIVPLDYVVYDLLKDIPNLFLRNRIIWTFGHGLHATDRFSGRHETLLWFTKGNKFSFNLDDVRVPQIYPGKRAYKGKDKGKPSGNPLGKNPCDVWELPNVKANHVEKTDHPCQFPVALAERVIKALSNAGDLVLDPFTGSGSTAAAAALFNRRFVGAEIDRKYHKIAQERLLKAVNGVLRYRSAYEPVYKPQPNTPLTTRPIEWSHTKHL